mmetsp:Transcript_48771/g.78603  ORF Transcript_48771/g.78603 Transcript_48771/m.78603 type:complete len:114 (-) Transcript_48771:114-455(-)
MHINVSGGSHGNRGVCKVDTSGGGLISCKCNWSLDAGGKDAGGYSCQGSNWQESNLKQVKEMRCSTASDIDTEITWAKETGPQLQFGHCTRIQTPSALLLFSLLVSRCLVAFI